MTYLLVAICGVMVLRFLVGVSRGWSGPAKPPELKQSPQLYVTFQQPVQVNVDQRQQQQRELHDGRKR